MELGKLEKWLPLGSILLSFGITLGGAWVSNEIQKTRMDERIATLQRDQAKHEMEKGKDIARNATKADDHEQRIVRLEVNIDTIQTTLLEIKSDVKSLLKARE